MTISRRLFLTRSSLALAAGALLPRLPAWPEGAGGIKPLRGGVGIFTASGGTIGCYMSTEALVVVDSQFPESATECLAALRQSSGRPIDALINTHHHGDHTAGNGVFREAAKRIVAQRRVPGLQKAAAGERGNEADQTYPDTTFDDEWKLDLGAETVVARHHLPAHTGGDAVVHFQNAGVVHMGDLIFNRWHPFIDRPGGASVRGWIDSLEKIVADHSEETLFIFGHGHEKFGVTGSAADLKLQRDYLSAVLETASKGIQAGKSLEEIRRQETLAGFEDHIARGNRLSLSANLAVAYEELRSP